MNISSRTRCVLVCAAFIGLFSIFSFRLIYLQAIKHDEYAGLAAEKHVYKQIIHAERGTILDANNEVLAHNIPVQTVVADATHLNNREAIVDLVSEELGLPPGEVAEKLSSERRYIIVKREVPEAQAGALREKLRAANLRGIYFEHDATRVYPNGSMLCHVIGFSDFDHRVYREWKRRWRNTFAGRMVFASSNTTAPDRRSSLIAGRSDRRATAIRCI